MTFHFFSPAPLPANEEERQRAVDAVEIDLPATRVAIAEAARLFDTPVALASLLDQDRQRIIASVGLNVEGTARSVAFCGYTILQPEVFHVEDASLDPRFAGNPLVCAGLQIRFYAGAPILTADGHALGALCVIDTVPHPAPNAEQAARLRRLAEHVARSWAPKEIGRIAATR